MKIETFEKTIDMPTYIEGYVNVEEFLECCKVCGNYDRKWSCPSYDFDPVEDYWKQFDTLHVVGKKMILAEEEKDDWENLITAANPLDSRVAFRKKCAIQWNPLAAM